MAEIDDAIVAGEACVGGDAKCVMYMAKSSTDAGRGAICREAPNRANLSQARRYCCMVVSDNAAAMNETAPFTRAADVAVCVWAAGPAKVPPAWPGRPVNVKDGQPTR